MSQGAAPGLATACLALAMPSQSHADPEIHADGRQIAYVRVSYGSGGGLLTA